MADTSDEKKARLDAIRAANAAKKAAAGEEPAPAPAAPVVAATTEAPASAAVGANMSDDKKARLEAIRAAKKSCCKRCTCCPSRCCCNPNSCCCTCGCRHACCCSGCTCCPKTSCSRQQWQRFDHRKFDYFADYAWSAQANCCGGCLLCVDRLGFGHGHWRIFARWWLRCINWSCWRVDGWRLASSQNHWRLNCIFAHKHPCNT